MSSPWVGAIGFLVLLVGYPLLSWRWRRRYRDEPFDSTNLERRSLAVQRFLYEGRTRFIGEVLAAVFMSGMSLVLARLMMSPTNKSSDQMDHGGGVPAWFAYPIGIVAAVGGCVWTIIEIERAEARRRRRMRPPQPPAPDAPPAPTRKIVITEPDRSADARRTSRVLNGVIASGGFVVP